MRILVAAALVYTALQAQAEPAGGAALSPNEQRWVEAAWPVFAEARRAGLPVDIVVQPQATPGVAPMATAYVDRRCKLVFSMRANPAVEAQEQRIERQLGPGRATLVAALEMMAAHELFGHCARHAAGQWRAVPEGYADAVPTGLDAALRTAYRSQRAQRREEGYADLAALDWVRAQRPAHHARLQAWLVWERAHDRIDGSPHDTLAWLQHAHAGLRAAAEVWREVLLEEADPAPAGQATTTAQSAGH